MVRISREILERLRRHGVREYPRECCGILIGRANGDVVEVVEVREAGNVAEEGRLKDRYSVDPLAIVKADRDASERGLEIVGFYHSHPDHPGQASATDAAHAWEAYVYLIVSVMNGAAAEEARAWRLVAEGKMAEVIME